MKWSNKETYLKIYEKTLDKNYPEIDNYEFKFKKIDINGLIN